MFLSIFFLAIIGTSQCCLQKTFSDGIVCVCNSTNCDDIPALDCLGNNTVQIYSTSRTEPGFNVKKVALSSKRNKTATQIRLTKETYQTITGFGGSFTDATGINIKSLPESAQDLLLQSYFGDNGIGYNLCRVPIGGTDFSVRPYSYDDVAGDRTLQHFQLQQEDVLYKVCFRIFNI